MNKQLNCFSGRRLTAWLSVVTILLAPGRLLAQSPDAFNPNANGAVYAMAVQPDGKILLGGNFGGLGGTNVRSRLARVTAEGIVDATFNPAPNNDVYGLVVQPDGRLLVIGTFSFLGAGSATTTSRSGIARFNADDTLDTTFDPKAGGSVASAIVQPDGRILLGGSFTTLGGQTRLRLGRVNADGTLDTTFFPSANGPVNTLAIQPDGKILVGGGFSQLNGQARNNLGRLNADGTLDTTFDPGANNQVNSLLVQPDGTILVAGTFTLLGGQSIKYLARMDAAGTVETSFAPQPDGPVYSFALQADGQLLFGGGFTSVGGQPRGRIARLYADGTLDNSFNPAPNNTVFGLAIQPDGQILVGGTFTTLGGQTRNRIGRLSSPVPPPETLAVENSTLTWQRTGTSPELSRVRFEWTTDGTDWSELAPLSHSAAGWQVTNLALPLTYAIRACGFPTGGQHNSSSSFVEAAVGDGASIIVTHPVSQTVSPGAAVALRVQAVGTPPLAYQWRRNGQDLPDATASTLNLNNISLRNAGNYSVIVSNSFGVVTSRVAQLTVNSTNAPLAFTHSPGPVRVTQARLHGLVNPRAGDLTFAWFEWGTDANYGRTTSLIEAGDGAQMVRVSALVEGLNAGGVYHYRLVVSNSLSVVWGVDKCFTTGMQLTTWGDYSQGYPAVPAGLTNIVAIASGHGHSLALRNDGTLLAWYSGFDTYPPDKIKIPSDLTNTATIAAGYSHNLALLEDGTVTSWGKYMFTSLPVTVPAGLSNVVAVAGGDSHSLALKSDGTVVAWGDNSSKQISVPAGLSNVIAIAAGSTHSLALKADGKVVAWGSSYYGGSMMPPTSLSNVVAISAESWHNLALRADGTLVAWGDNSAGQSSVPAGLSNVIAIATGFRHSLALKADGTLMAWGSPYYVTNLPASLSQVIAISSGDYHSLALTPMNAAPRPLNTSATGYPDQDLVIGLRAWDPNGDQLSYRIASLPASGILYQYTDTGRGDLISLPNTPVSDPAGRVLFVPPPEAFGAPYTTFGLIANDGALDSATGLLTVILVPPPAIQSGAWIRNTRPGFALSFPGLSNASYTVLVSTNLLNWNWLGSATQTSAGQFYFLDSGATNQPKRFYRLRSP